MRAIVDEETCTGCGLCVDVCPEVFEMNGDLATVIQDPVPEECLDTCAEARDNCPTDAIHTEE